MNGKMRVLAAVIALFSVGFTVSAQTGSYAFSGFGGGLPSSVTKVDDATADVTLLRTVSSTDGSGSSGAGKVAIIVVGSVIATGLLVGGGVWLFKSATENCSSNACNTSCSNMCGDSLNQLCSDSISQSCSKSNVRDVFAQGLALMPTYVP